MASTYCPSSFIISQFIDHELTGSEQNEVSTHVASCPRCTTQIQHLQQMEYTMRTASHHSSYQVSEPTRTTECPASTVVTDYVLDLLPEALASNMETHLFTCDHCLAEVQEATHMTRTLASRQSVAVPLALKTQIATTWEPPLTTRAATAFSRLVIHASRKGLELIEQHIVAPFLDVQQMLVPVPAYRADQAPQVLDLKIHTGKAEIQATAFQEGDGVSLQMTLVGSGQGALSGQRVFLRQGGRSIFSARTNSEGNLRTPHLQPGTYEVACAGIDATFELELRA